MTRRLVPARDQVEMLSPWREGSRVPDPTFGGPLYSETGDPTHRVPTGDLLRHRIFNPAITTPEEMHDSLWHPTYDPDAPLIRAPQPNPGSSDGRNWYYDTPSGYERSEDADHGFRSKGRGGGTEHGLVEAIERGERLDPVEIATNGLDAVLTDGNHRAEVADMMSVPDLDSHVWYDPHRSELHEKSQGAPVDPDSGLGRIIHELVQNHPYEPVAEHGFKWDDDDDRSVFRRDPSTGLWVRGWAGHEAEAFRKRDLDGDREWDGPGMYHEVQFPDRGDVWLHERHLHANLRTASPMFDWRRSPEYDAPGISADHHSAPLENGDRLHAYRVNTDAINPWLFEIEPHDMPPRLPLVFHDGVNHDLPRKPIPMTIARNPAVDPPGTDRKRRNFSGWGRQLDDGTWENGTFHTSLSDAMDAVERRYLEEAPKWGSREPHRRGGFDYDGFFDPGHGGGDDDFGDIFGEGK